MIAAFVTALVIIFWDYLAAEWNARDAQREVVTLADSIQIGATRESVAETFARGNFKHLTRRPHVNDDEWFFHTPYRFGATDWILIVAFDRDSVIAIRVATSDDLRRRPTGAPSDRVKQITR